MNTETQDIEIHVESPSSSELLISWEGLLIVTLALFHFLKDQASKFLENRKIKKGYFEKGKARYDEICSILDNMLEIACADRVLFLQFHDGQKLLSNFHLLRWTITHQRCIPGTAPVPNLDSQPIGDIYQEFSKLKDRGCFCIDLRKDNSYIRSGNPKYISDNGIEGLGFFLVENEYSVPIGMLEIHYCSHNNNQTITDRKHEETCLEIKNSIKDIIKKLS